MKSATAPLKSLTEIWCERPARLAGPFSRGSEKYRSPSRLKRSLSWRTALFIKPSRADAIAGSAIVPTNDWKIRPSASRKPTPKWCVKPDRNRPRQKFLSFLNTKVFVMTAMGREITAIFCVGSGINLRHCLRLEVVIHVDEGKHACVAQSSGGAVAADAHDVCFHADRGLSRISDPADEIQLVAHAHRMVEVDPVH